MSPHTSLPRKREQLSAQSGAAADLPWAGRPVSVAVASGADVTDPRDVICLVFVPKSVSCSHCDKIPDGPSLGTLSCTSDQDRWGRHRPGSGEGTEQADPEPECR